jgi:probable HAF family extracellular repeat protein
MSSTPFRMRRAPVLLLPALLAACVDQAPTPTSARPEAVAPAAGPVESHQVGTGTHVVNLGVPGTAYDINDAGQVAGTTQYTGQKPRAFTWTPASPGASNGSLRILPDLSLRDSSLAYGINETGQVVGTSRNSTGYERAVLWTRDGSGGYRPKDLGVIAYPGLHSWGAGISNAGHVTGYAHNAARAIRAFLWTPASPGDTTGAMQDLGTLGGARSYGRDVNSDGWVVGESLLADGRTRAFLWTPGTGMINLGALPGAVHSSARGINEAGQIVGESGGHAFLWTPSGPGATTGTMRDLGTLPTYPTAYSTFSDGWDVNEQGMVVGDAMQGSHEVGMIWTEQGGMRDLPTAGTDRLAGAAYGINASGHVAGWTVVLENGYQVKRAVIWRGVASNVAPVAAISHPTGLVSGHRYAFSATGSTDADGDALTYAWTYWYRDVATGVNNPTSVATLKLDSAGTYTLRLIVTDDDGARDTAWTTFAVEQNLPPDVSVAGGPITVGEGVPAIIPLNVGDPNQATDTTEVSGLYFQWFWGDGTSSVGRGGRKYADQGVYTVKLYVTDRGGMIDSLTTQVTVTNSRPSAVVTATNTTYEASPYTIAASSPSDPGTADRATLQFAFDCGRGGGYGAFGTTRTVTCPALVDQDTFVTRTKVRDKDGGETEYLRTVRVNNARPVVEARLWHPYTPQGPLYFRFTDAGASDGPWQYRVRNGNGTYSAWMPATPDTWITTPEYTYPSPGTYDASVYVRDKDGGIGYSAPVTLTSP